MKTVDKIEAIRAEYAVTHRLVYWLRKNLVYLIMIFACALVIRSVPMELSDDGAIDPFAVATNMLAQAIMAASVKLFVCFLVLKFGLPKLAFQEEIIVEKNIAVALVFLGIAWIVA